MDNEISTNFEIFLINLFIRSLYLSFKFSKFGAWKNNFWKIELLSGTREMYLEKQDYGSLRVWMHPNDDFLLSLSRLFETQTNVQILNDRMEKWIQKRKKESKVNRSIGIVLGVLSIALLAGKHSSIGNIFSHPPDPLFV